MPTRDYDPINDIIEAIHKTSVSTWPTIKATADTNGKVYISCGNPDSCITTTPIKIVMDGSLPIVEEKPVNPFAIRSVLSNHRKNAFTVVWEDGTTTVVHCQEGDEWDDEKALAMCFTKKALGNKGNFNDKFNDALDNKMKVIKSEKEIVEEVANTWKETLRSPINGQLTIDDIQTTIRDVPTREEVDNTIAEAMKKAEQSAEKAVKNLGNMIKELVESAESKEEKTYELYLIGSFTNTKKLVHRGTISVLRGFIKSYAKKADLGYYFRTWNADGGMYLDYGSYTQYFFIPGITNSEYAGK